MYDHVIAQLITSQIIRDNPVPKHRGECKAYFINYGIKCPQKATAEWLRKRNYMALEAISLVL